MKKIRNKIYLRIVLPVILIYGVILGIGLRFVNRSFEQEAVRNNQHNLENISRGMNDWMVSRISEMVNLADIPLLSGGEEEAILTYLGKWRKRFSFNYRELYFITPDSLWISTAGERGPVPGNPVHSYFFGEFYHPYYMGPLDRFLPDREELLIAVPVLQEDRLSGYLAGVIEMTRFKKVLKFFTFDEFDSFMMVGNGGMIIAHSESGLEGRGEREVYGEEFSASKKYGQEFVFVKELRTGWKLVAFLSGKRLLAPIGNMNRLVILSSSILFLLLAAFTYYLTFLFASPIRKLKGSVTKIMHGDYSEKVELSSDDEFQQLADTLNLLTDKMIRRRMDDRFLFLGHFAARMAHDMRHPLNLISLITEDLQSDYPDRKEDLSQILREVQNTDRFIRNILDFSKDDHMERMEISLNELIGETLERMSHLFLRENIRMEFLPGPSQPPLYLDIQKITQVLTNLIQNAVDALSESGAGAPRQISIRTVCRDRAVLLTIEDNGPGFQEGYIDQMFDPYFTTREEGTGLGLSICYRYLSLHGAEITLANSEGHHGIVSVTFPFS